MTNIDDSNTTPPGFWFGEIEARLRDRMRADLTELGLRRGGWRVLHTLADAPATPDELAARLPRGRRHGRPRGEGDPRRQWTRNGDAEQRPGWTRGREGMPGHSRDWPHTPWGDPRQQWMRGRDADARDWPHGHDPRRGWTQDGDPRRGWGWTQDGDPRRGAPGHDGPDHGGQHPHHDEPAHDHDHTGPYPHHEHPHEGQHPHHTDAHPAEHAFERGFLRGFDRGMRIPRPPFGGFPGGFPGPFPPHRRHHDGPRRPFDRILADFTERGWVWFDGERATLTDEGRAAHDEAFARVRGIRSALVDGISDEDYATTIATLRAMAENLGWRPRNESGDAIAEESGSADAAAAPESERHGDGSGGDQAGREDGETGEERTGL